MAAGCLASNDRDEGDSLLLQLDVTALHLVTQLLHQRLDERFQILEIEMQLEV